jgi:hypothetical protein
MANHVMHVLDRTIGSSGTRYPHVIINEGFQRATVESQKPDCKYAEGVCRLYRVNQVLGVSAGRYDDKQVAGHGEVFELSGKDAFVALVVRKGAHP